MNYAQMSVNKWKWREINRDKAVRECCLAMVWTPFLSLGSVCKNPTSQQNRMMTIIFISTLDVSMSTIHFDWAMWLVLSVRAKRFVAPSAYPLSCAWLYFPVFPGYGKLLCSVIFSSMISNADRKDTLDANRCRMKSIKLLPSVTLCDGEFSFIFLGHQFVSVQSWDTVVFQSLLFSLCLIVKAVRALRWDSQSWRTTNGKKTSDKRNVMRYNDIFFFRLPHVILYAARIWKPFRIFFMTTTETIQKMWVEKSRLCCLLFVVVYVNFIIQCRKRCEQH